MTQPPSYSLGSYLKDRWFQLLIAGVVLLGLAVMLPAFGLNLAAIIVIEGFILLGYLFLFGSDYVRRYRFYDDAIKLVDQVQHVYEVPSLLQWPDFLDGQVAYTIVEDLSRQSGEEIGLRQKEFRDYREFIELWVHEIKTPLAASRLMLATMHGEQAVKLSKELDRAELQVEQVLYYARMASLANDYHIHEVALAELLKDSCRKYARYLIECKTTPVIEVADSETVLADDSWLRFMVGQIITNSAKYEATSVVFRSWEENANTPHGKTILEIADNGMGIKAADVPRVFDKGFIGQNGRAKGSATGIGLYLVAEMAERMGLSITLASEEGSGTRVLLGFPHDRRHLSLTKM